MEWTNLWKENKIIQKVMQKKKINYWKKQLYRNNFVISSICSEVFEKFHSMRTSFFLLLFFSQSFTGHKWRFNSFVDSMHDIIVLLCVWFRLWISILSNCEYYATVIYVFCPHLYGLPYGLALLSVAFAQNTQFVVI